MADSPLAISLQPRLLADFKAVDWIVLAAGTIAIALFSEGVHDLAISHLGVPHPVSDAVPAWSKCLNACGRITALVFFCRLASGSLDARRLAVAATQVGLLVVGLNETLRVTAIEWEVLDGWRHLHWVVALTDRAAIGLACLFEGAIVAVIARRFPRGRDALTLAAILAAGLSVLSVAASSPISRGELSAAPPRGSSAYRLMRPSRFPLMSLSLI